MLAALARPRLLPQQVPLPQQLRVFPVVAAVLPVMVLTVGIKPAPAPSSVAAAPVYRQGTMLPLVLSSEFSV